MKDLIPLIGIVILVAVGGTLTGLAGLDHGWAWLGGFLTYGVVDWYWKRTNGTEKTLRALGLET